MFFRVLCIIAAALAASALSASFAFADETPTVAPRVRAPNSVLRQVDTQTLEVPPTAHPDTSAKQVVILVAGYSSCACINDDAFDNLRQRLISSGFDVVSFGTDPRFPYDTQGRLEMSAINLRDHARVLGKRYAGVHIVTHSMGGVVADRAFADGLSAADGVLTYIAWAAPHDGSTIAGAVEFVKGTHGDMGAVRELARPFGSDPDSIATRDLAATYALAPPADVVRLDIREATDFIVSERDARDPGVPSRILETHRPGLQDLDGHGAVMIDPNAIDLTVRTIATRRVPPDERSRDLINAAQRRSDTMGFAGTIALFLLTAGLCLRVINRRNAKAVMSVVRRVVPLPEQCP